MTQGDVLEYGRKPNCQGEEEGEREGREVGVLADRWRYGWRYCTINLANRFESVRKQNRGDIRG